MSLRFPTGGDYVEAIQSPGICFHDPDLRSAVPQLDRLGRPRPISGNFASVFSLHAASGRRYAVKCFTREVADQGRRYQAISDYLLALPNDWKIGFEYLRQGVLVNGRWFPALKMEWVEGVGLIRWIEEHLGDHGAMRDMAARFAELVAELEQAGVAHGDLQHGNLLVAPGGALKLVDYDGMFVPTLAGFPAAERGHRHYQSPHRSGVEFGPHLDRFSAWLIHRSLMALSADPGLWHLLHEHGGEHLLFRDEDFTAAGGSGRLAALGGHPAPDIRAFAGEIASLAALPLHELPALTPDAPPSVRTAQPTRASSSGLPAWMRGHVATPAAPPVPVGYNAAALWRTRMGISWTYLVLGVIAWVLGLSAIALVATAMVALGGGYAASMLIFAAIPESKARRTLAARYARARRRSEEDAKSLNALKRQRDMIQAEGVERAAANTRELGHLRTQHQRILQEFDQETAAQIGAYDLRLNALQSRRSAELLEALHLLRERERHSQTVAHLKRIFLRPGDVHGVGPDTVGRLGHNGIVTAADFLDIQHVAVSNGTTTSGVRVLLPGQRWISVPGVEEASAQALMAWRKAHLDAAMRYAVVPAVLPGDVAHRIESRYAAEEHALRQGYAETQLNRQKGRHDLERKQESQRVNVANRHFQAARNATQALSEVKRKAAAAKKDQMTALRECEELHRELLAYRDITYKRFIRALFTGR
ncbi:hypothetical protein [Sinosporangium siamense]|uniref:Protein kinase domain-containing protein n=1 Tax=Sinosporangium siamense TaxID=1367973 RepID=A0A919RKE2_9ACTN|nr:hypothetical protein [Sinosporangium siamense]GII93656.1 hypothetical protein Ssi02_38870 [Sinosporangium siamense]